MAQITINKQDIRKIDHLEKMAHSIFEEIKKMKFAFLLEKPLSLRGILKGVRIPEKEMKEAEKSLFKEIKI